MMEGLEDELYEEDGPQFYDPGSGSALRAGKRDQPCPTCCRPNAMTQEDVDLHYQCDSCADAAERGIDHEDFCD